MKEERIKMNHLKNQCNIKESSNGELKEQKDKMQELFEM